MNNKRTLKDTLDAIGGMLLLVAFLQLITMCMIITK